MKTQKQDFQNHKSHLKFEFNLFQPGILNYDWNVEVFRHSNKLYGAFELRRQYPKQILRSFIISIGFVVSILFIATCFQKEKRLAITELINAIVIEPTLLDFPPPAEKIQTAPALLTPIENAPILISKDSAIKKIKDTQKINDKTTVAVGDTSGDFKKTKLNTEIGIGIHQKSNGIEKKDSIFKWVPEMPEYPGGLEALNKFISSKVRTNNSWKESGSEGKVIYEFTVGKGGEIRDIKILMDGVYFGLADLNLSIFDKMPKWKPGKNNGNTVSVLYRIPIKFVKE